MKFLKDISNKQGMYRIAFTVCILVMSLVVISLTENSNQIENKEVSGDNNQAVANYSIENDDVEKIISDMQQKENVILSSESDSAPLKELEDLSFAPPVWGKISKKFSGNMPLYSKTMDDWRIHVGVDILCPLGSDIFSAGDGVVADIGYDINLGDYITVESNEFATRYASVVPDELVTIGTTVSKGQKLGTLADSCVSEICDEPHLHFEMKKDGIYIDPAEHILFE